jgi:TonB-linked SusC/RagA family outer membrane protein
MLGQQQTTITGKVVDKSKNQPLTGAIIRIKGSNAGTATNENGDFQIITKQSLPITLNVSYVGFEAQEIDVYEAAPITITLAEDANRLNEVVVVGYGTQKKAEIAGSISSISASTLKQATASSFDNLLQGSVSGVVATQSSSAPGSTTSIRIRGGNSVNFGNDPLYVIDGFLVYNNNDYVNTGAGKGESVNALSTINPSDIESIDILKDASATAIYGSRGANGVVIITTKKGKKGVNQINYNVYYGTQVVAKKIDLLNAAQWDRLQNDIYASVPVASRNGLNYFTDEQIAADGAGSDWQGAALRKGLLQNHDLSFTGGDDKSRYLISGNYFNQQGIVLNTDFKRYSGRINYEREVSKKLKISANTFGSQSTENKLIGNAYSNLLAASPRTPIYNADGSYNVSTNSYLTTVTNPLQDLVSVTNKTYLTRILANVSGEYKIVKDLTLKVSGGADITYTKQNYYAPSYTSAGIAVSGSASVGNSQVYSWLNENTLTYDHSFSDKHFLNILAGYTTQYQEGESAVATAQTFPNDLSTYNNLGSGTAQPLSSSSFVKTLNSFLGRVSYSYLHKYNVTISERADGASVLGSNNKWGYFSSIGLSWNASKEKFFQPFNKTISDLKVRLSAGQTGNSEVPPYSSLQALGTSNYYFNNVLVTGLAPTQLANQNLAWETTTQYDAGVDLGLLNNRISIVFDAYYKKTTNLLLNVPLPLYTGYQSALENVGSVENKGLEFSLNTENIKSKDFSWRSTIVFSHNASKILSLGQGVSSYFPVAPTGQVSPVIVAVGQPVGTFWGYSTNGLLTATDIANGYPVLGGVSQIAGDKKYVPLDPKATKITTADKHFLGSAQPRFTGSVSNTFNYQNINLTFFFQGSYGNKMFNYLLQQTLEIPKETANASANLLNRYSESNPNGTLPRATNSPVPQVIDRYVEDASYLRLKTVTLSYTLPGKIASKIYANQLKVYVTGQNLLTLTNYSGTDPEANFYTGDNTKQGIDNGVYPSSKTYLVGINITF